MLLAGQLAILGVNSRKILCSSGCFSHLTCSSVTLKAFLKPVPLGLARSVSHICVLSDVPRSSGAWTSLSGVIHASRSDMFRSTRYCVRDCLAQDAGESTGLTKRTAVMLVAFGSLETISCDTIVLQRRSDMRSFLVEGHTANSTFRCRLMVGCAHFDEMDRS